MTPSWYMNWPKATGCSKRSIPETSIEKEKAHTHIYIYIYNCLFSVWVIRGTGPRNTSISTPIESLNCLELIATGFLSTRQSVNIYTYDMYLLCPTPKRNDADSSKGLLWWGFCLKIATSTRRCGQLDEHLGSRWIEGHRIEKWVLSTCTWWYCHLSFF